MEGDTLMIFKAKKEIHQLLKDYPKLRDSDLSLVAQVWNDEMWYAGHDVNRMRATEFIDRVFLGEVTPPETITRIRRKLQQENPELRGEKYKKRHAAQEDVKEELREKTLWQM